MSAVPLDEEIWGDIPKEDKWVFNKLDVALKGGIKCGLREIKVPYPGHYIIRPIYNLSGMGYEASKTYLTPAITEALVPPGYFWSEELKGKHISVDYTDGEVSLVVEGFKGNYTLQYWDKWVKLKNNKAPTPPSFLEPIIKKYKHVNIEFIGGKVIEVHLRENPDFKGHNYGVLIPVWDDKEFNVPEGYSFIKNEENYLDKKRIGFLGK